MTFLIGRRMRVFVSAPSGTTELTGGSTLRLYTGLSTAVPAPTAFGLVAVVCVDDLPDTVAAGVDASEALCVGWPLTEVVAAEPLQASACVDLVVDTMTVDAAISTVQTDSLELVLEVGDLVGLPSIDSLETSAVIGDLSTTPQVDDLTINPAL